MISTIDSQIQCYRLQHFTFTESVRFNRPHTQMVNYMRTNETDGYRVCRCFVQCYTWRNAIGSALNQWKENSKLVVQCAYANKTTAFCLRSTRGPSTEIWGNHSLCAIHFFCHFELISTVANFCFSRILLKLFKLKYARRRNSFYFNFFLFYKLVWQNLYIHPKIGLRIHNLPSYQFDIRLFLFCRLSNIDNNGRENCFQINISF